MQSTVEYKAQILDAANQHRSKLMKLEQQFVEGKLTLMQFAEQQGKEIVRYRAAVAKIRKDRDEEVRTRNLKGRVDNGGV